MTDAATEPGASRYVTRAERRAAMVDEAERDCLKFTRVVRAGTDSDRGFCYVDSDRIKEYRERVDRGEVQPDSDVEEDRQLSPRPKKRKRVPQLEKIELPTVEPDENGKVLGVIWPYCTHIYGGDANTLDPFTYMQSQQTHFYYRLADDHSDDELKNVDILMKTTRDDTREVAAQAEDEEKVDYKEDEEVDREVPWWKKVDPEKYKQAVTVYAPAEIAEIAEIAESKEVEEVREEVTDRSKAKRRRLNPRSFLTAAWNVGAAIFKFLTSKMQD